MKKIFTLILAFFPLCNLMAQSEWELPNSSVPTEKTTKTKTKKENTSIAKEDNSKVVEIKEEDKPYLEGAVPEVEGKIVFSRTINIPNKNASEIYDKTYQYLEQFTKSNTSLPGFLTTFSLSIELNSSAHSLQVAKTMKCSYALKELNINTK